MTTRHIYRNPSVEKELEDIKRQLDALRKHNRDHFRMGALVSMEHASDWMARAISETHLSPKHVEELTCQ